MIKLQELYQILVQNPNVNDYFDNVYKVAKNKMNKKSIEEYTIIRKRYA